MITTGTFDLLGTEWKTGERIEERRHFNFVTMAHNGDLTFIRYIDEHGCIQSYRLQGEFSFNVEMEE